MAKSEHTASSRSQTLVGEELSQAIRDLRSVELLADLSDLELEVLRGGLAIRSYRPGAVLVKYRDPANSIFIIISGKLSARRLDPSGKELILGHMGPGAIVGELAILTGGMRSSDVIVQEPAVIAEIAAAHFAKLLGVSPRFSLKLMRALAERVQVASERLNEVSFLDLNQRLLQTLARLATPVEISGKETLLVRELPSHQELASLLCCSREAVTRALKLLSAKGIIEVRDGQAKIFLKPAVSAP